jgi:hypothetical protein
MLASRAPDAEQALLAALAADQAFAGVTIIDVPVTDATAAPEVVYVDSVEFDQSWRGSTRPASRNDDFTINMVILVRRGGVTPSAVKARAWQLVAAVQAVVTADWSLGGVLNQSAEVAGGVVSPYPASIDGAWEARVDLRVRGQAVLTE